MSGVRSGNERRRKKPIIARRLPRCFALRLPAPPWVLRWRSESVGACFPVLNPNLSKLLAWKFFRRSHLPCHRLSLATCDETLDSTPVAFGGGRGDRRHGEFCNKPALFSRSTRLSVRAY